VAEATIRARIKTVVSGVSNVGLVYDYERWKSDWSDYLDTFKTTISSVEYIRAWTITCESFRPVELATMGGGADIEVDYIYKIRGYFGLDDAHTSEKTAIALVESVINALNADTTLHAYYGSGPHPLAELTIFEPRAFGDVMCHYAEITLPVKERS
jgi:hypothetical protein